MRTHQTSTADIEATAEALLAGAATNAELVQKYCLDQKALADMLERFRRLDARQEQAKADLHQVSQDLYSVRKQIRNEFGRWVSVLEGQLGKNNKKLQEFGIAPRNLRPHKGPRGTTDSNTPANGTPTTPNPPAQPQLEA